jgi:hypothetical protein
METYFQAVHQQASYRADGTIPDLETYIWERRETSGCKPAFDLIEYALNLELPEYVVEHPVISALNHSANDLVSWSNVRTTSFPLPTPHVSKKERIRIYSHTTSNNVEMRHIT